MKRKLGMLTWMVLMSMLVLELTLIQANPPVWVMQDQIGIPIDSSCKLWLKFWQQGGEATRIIDYSGNNNHGVITGAVPYPGNPQITSVGSTYNYGDFTAANAFFWSSIDLSPYAGTDLGSTPYWIELVDSVGKKATGYIGAVGAGETLGSEIVVNGDMELDSNWLNLSTPTTNERSNSQAHGGTYSRHIITDAENEGIKQYQTHTSLGLYYHSSWYYPTIGVNYQMYGNQSGLNSGILTLTLNLWSNFNQYFTVNVETSQQMEIYGTNVINEMYIDDISTKRITDPPSTAIHIVSSLNGTTRNWASIESGFNPNTITSWKINSVIPNQAIGWYFDDVDDLVAHPSINFGKTHTLLYWLRSFANAKDIIHGGAANYHVAIDGTNIYYNAGATELSQAHGGRTGNPTMIGIRRSGTTVQFFKNGVQIGVDQTLDANNDLTLTTLGSYDTPGTFLGGVIQEGIGFNVTKAVQEYRNYYELTRAKYGV